MTGGSQLSRRLAVALVGIFVLVVGVFHVARTYTPGLELGVTVATATCIVVAVVRRWRIVPADLTVPVQRIEDKLDLAHVLGDTFLPFGGWAMEPSSLVRILSEVQVEGHRSIVEFGSGLSTLLMAKVIRQRGWGKIVSFEEDQRWSELMRALLAHEGLIDFAEIVHAPLEPFDGTQGREPWYALALVEGALRQVKHADLVIIDGPISSHAMSRYPALPVLARLGVIDEATSIVLDDAHRANEREVLASWQVALGARFELIGDSQRGQAMVRLPEGTIGRAAVGAWRPG